MYVSLSYFIKLMYIMFASCTTIYNKIFNIHNINIKTSNMIIAGENQGEWSTYHLRLRF